VTKLELEVLLIYPLTQFCLLFIIRHFSIAPLSCIIL